MKLGRFDIDTEDRCLLLDGEPVRLGTRAFDILVTIAAAGGRLVTRNEIMDAVWPGVIVEECNIDVHISALRKALGRDRDLIVTVSGRGYRCIQSRPAAAPKQAAVRPLPPLSLPARNATLYGRTETIPEIGAALRAARLVTLVGIGGVGKTSVAVALAHEAAPEFDQRVAFVDLAELSEPGAIATAIARDAKIEIPDTAATVEAIAAGLGAQPCLLVLDNAEHLVGATAQFVEALLALNDAVRFLVTSRESLLIREERVIRVEPLDVPQADVGLTELLGNAAVQLFLDCVGRAAVSAEGDGAVIRTIAEICRRLDGLPLAIELAARRAALLGVEGVRRRLGDRLTLLSAGYRGATPRHRALRATFESSFVLLSDTAQRLFQRLSAFSDAFTFDALRTTVCDFDLSEERALDAIEELVAKSLVNVRLQSSEATYHLFESARAFAASKLPDAAPNRDRVAANPAPLRAAA